MRRRSFDLSQKMRQPQCFSCHGVTSQSKRNQYLFRGCAEHGLFEIVKLLVEKGNIDVNEDLELCDFALDEALWNEQFEIAHYLAEHQAILK